MSSSSGGKRYSSGHASEEAAKDSQNNKIREANKTLAEDEKPFSFVLPTNYGVSQGKVATTS